MRNLGVPFAEQCKASSSHPDDDEDTLDCWRRAGHDGPHDDVINDVRWSIVTEAVTSDGVQ
jgi:hypothetical protein